MTTQGQIQGFSTVHGLNINKGLEVLLCNIGLVWAGCTRWPKESARFVSIYKTPPEHGTSPSIQISLSAILLPTTSWPSEDTLEIPSSMRWHTAAVNHSQRPMPITIATQTTVQTPSEVDSGLAVVLMLYWPRPPAIISLGQILPLPMAGDTWMLLRRICCVRGTIYESWNFSIPSSLWGTFWGDTLE